MAIVDWRCKASSCTTLIYTAEVKSSWFLFRVFEIYLMFSKRCFITWPFLLKKSVMEYYLNVFMLFVFMIFIWNIFMFLNYWKMSKTFSCCLVSNGLHMFWFGQLNILGPCVHVGPLFLSVLSIFVECLFKTWINKKMSLNTCFLGEVQGFIIEHYFRCKCFWAFVTLLLLGHLKKGWKAAKK